MAFYQWFSSLNWRMVFCRVDIPESVMLSIIEACPRCFHLEAMIRTFAVTIRSQVFCGKAVLVFLGRVSQTASLGCVARMFNLCKTCLPVFQSGCTTLPVRGEPVGALGVLHANQHLMSVLSNVTHSSVKWNLIVVLICIPLLANEVEHLHTYWPFG